MTGSTTTTCHICGTAKPSTPSEKYPVCGACYMSVYRHKRQDHLPAKAAQLSAELHLLVVRIRRVRAARFGLESLPPIYWPTAESGTPPKT